MIVDSALYVDGKRSLDTHNIEFLLETAEKSDGFFWIGLLEPSAAEFHEMSEQLHFHPLAIEDAVSALQRPKIEEFQGLHFIVAKTVFFKEIQNDVTTGELMFFVGKNFIVIVRHGEGNSLGNLRHDLESHPEFLKLGPWAVVHAVLDRVIDEYTKIAGQFYDAIAVLENKVFGVTRKTYSQEIYVLKREVTEYRHAVEPLIFHVQKLASETARHCPEELFPFFRDLSDHLNKACENAAGLDSLLTTVLQADLAHVQLRQNEDMRKISAWIGIAAVPTMVAAIYGMNFTNMPELEWKFGYWIILAGMGVISISLYRIFKKSGWL